jgi:hypothetical protein
MQVGLTLFAGMSAKPARRLRAAGMKFKTQNEEQISIHIFVRIHLPALFVYISCAIEIYL